MSQKKKVEIVEVEEGLFNDGFYKEHHFTVDPGQSTYRIDKFILERIEGVSRNKIQNAIKAQTLTVNDNIVKANYKVRPNDKVKILIPKARESMLGILPEEIPLNIVYEDDDLLIINKQPGLVVHPGVGNWTGTLVNALAYYFENKELPLKDGNFSDRPGLVHRIDKDTSGLLLIAKTDFAMTHLSKQFFDHSVDRTYQALVWGEPEEKEATINANLGRHPTNRMEITVLEEGMGKHAITHYKVLLPMYYVSLVECKLETGRTHQIRAHMKHIGSPLFNDARYGGHKIIKGTVYSKYRQFVINTFKVMPRQALHAKTLGFTHPTTGERMHFDSDLPADFQECLDRWKNYLSYRKENLTGA